MKPSWTAPIGDGPPKDPDKTRVVYILGAGRCGTTILDLMIGSAPGVLSSGELWHLPTIVRVLGGELPHYPALVSPTAVSDSRTRLLCSCGDPVSSCPLWSAVSEEFSSKYDFRELYTGNRRFERLYFVPLALSEYLRQSPAFKRHLEMMGYLLRSSTRRAGANLIVDSSKIPLRGLLYLLLPREEFDVRFIHIVRDGEDFLDSIIAHPDPAESDSPPSKQPPWLTALYYAPQWMFINALCSAMKPFLGNRYLQIRYEDLASRPTEVLQSIGTFLDIDLSEVSQKVLVGGKLSSGHILAGNRLKFDPVWKPASKSQSPRKRTFGRSMIFNVVAGWLQLLYGYR
jgi:Sulfotransferase family